MNNNSKGKKIKELCISGFALFAMLFGAGNLIFPPALGLMTGEKWLESFMAFFFMDVVVSVLGVFAMVIYDGKLERISERLGRKVSCLFLSVLVLCIGPLVAIPRTGTVTFSMAIKPIFGLNGDTKMALAVFSVLFFAIVFFFSIKPGRVVDIVGKYMTPVLLICLVVTIFLGIINNSNNPGEVLVDDPVKEGIIDGYQTCDGIASIVFAGVVIETARGKHPGKLREADNQIYIAGIMAGALLFVVYVGLCYLGVVWGGPFADGFIDGTINQAELLVNVIGSILGSTGIFIIAIITLFACLTTAIGLTTACAECLATLFSKKISYERYVIGITLFSLILTNAGLSRILAIASPILNLLYPPVITLIILGLFSKRIQGRYTFVMGAAASFAVSATALIYKDFGITALSFIEKLPLNNCGLNFVIPTLAAVAVGLIIDGAAYKCSTQ